MPQVFPAAFKDVELDLRFGGGACAFMVLAREVKSPEFNLLLLHSCEGLNQQPADAPRFKAADVRLFQRGGEMLSWFY